MKVLVVLEHPYTIDSAGNVPHQRSFSAAVAAAAVRGAQAAGHEVDLIDLAADGLLRQLEYQAGLAAARGERPIDTGWLRTEPGLTAPLSERLPVT